MDWLKLITLFHFHIMGSASLSSQLQDKTESKRKQRQKEQRNHIGLVDLRTEQAEKMKHNANIRHVLCTTELQTVELCRRTVCDLGLNKKNVHIISWPKVPCDGSDLNCVCCFTSSAQMDRTNLFVSDQRS